MNSSLRFFIRLAALILLLGVLATQRPAHAQIAEADATRNLSFRTIVGRVVTPLGDPIPNVSIEIFSNPLKTADTDRRGEFQIDYQFMNPLDISNFSAIMQITKKGYPESHKLVEFNGASKMVTFPIILYKPLDDPSVLPQADLVQGIGSRLREVGPADGLSSKYAKDYARGVQEFLDRSNHLDRAMLSFAKVAKGDPACLRCRTMMAIAELAWGDRDGATAELVDTVNAIAKDRSLARPEPLLAYGVLTSWQHDPDKAIPYFQEALRNSPSDALALQELGRAQCQIFDWEEARATLAKALEAGAGPEARFLHAEALLWSGTVQEARSELDRYLDGRDIKSMPQRVRGLADQIEVKRKDAKAFAVLAATQKAKGETPIDYLTQPPKGLDDFEQANDQSLLDAILGSVGRNVQEFYKNFPNTSSVELIHQEMLTDKGKVGLTHDQKFNYLCLIPAMPWGPSTDEYRADSTGALAIPKGIEQNFMLTSGFVAAPLVFHPVYQSGSSFHYWGRQKVNGTPTYIIAYAQRPGRSRISGSFRMGNVSRQTYFQGLVWVDASTYQIVRLTSDLLTPMPQVRLSKETTEIEFNQVQFASANRKFWLPEQVTVTLGWDGHTLRNRHQYSDFRVFDVDQKQRISSPKAAPPVQP